MAYQLPQKALYGSAYYPFHSIGDDYPDGGTLKQYDLLHHVDIGTHDLGVMHAITKAFIRDEHARVAATTAFVSIEDQKAFEEACWTVARDAWNDSAHLSMNGKPSKLTNTDTFKEQLCGSKWPSRHDNIVRRIRAQVNANPVLAIRNRRPASITHVPDRPGFPTPQWARVPAQFVNDIHNVPPPPPPRQAVFVPQAPMVVQHQAPVPSQVGYHHVPAAMPMPMPMPMPATATAAAADDDFPIDPRLLDSNFDNGDQAEHGGNDEDDDMVD